MHRNLHSIEIFVMMALKNAINLLFIVPNVSLYFSLSFYIAFLLMCVLLILGGASSLPSCQPGTEIARQVFSYWSCPVEFYFWVLIGAYLIIHSMEEWCSYSSYGTTQFLQFCLKFYSNSSVPTLRIIKKLFTN